MHLEDDRSSNSAASLRHRVRINSIHSSTAKIKSPLTRDWMAITSATEKAIELGEMEPLWPEVALQCLSDCTE